MPGPKSVRPLRAPLLLLVLILGLAACGGGSGQTEDFSFLNGTWVIDQTLVEIDNEERRPTVEIPSAQWECTVEGTTMTMQTVSYRYVGELTAEGDGWAYQGSASFQDDKGDIWTSTIEVHATMDGEDTFGGTMERSIDSDKHGHDYTATWNIVGRRK